MSFETCAKPGREKELAEFIEELLLQPDTWDSLEQVKEMALAIAHQVMQKMPLTITQGVGRVVDPEPRCQTSEGETILVCVEDNYPAREGQEVLFVEIG